MEFERQLLQLVLAEPGLIPTAAAAIIPEAITHSGLRRILAELYAAQAAGAVPDLDYLRDRLNDRLDLFDAAVNLYNIGQSIRPEERGRWLQKVLDRFEQVKTDTELRILMEQLAAAAGDPAKEMEILRKIQMLKKKTTIDGDGRGPSPST